MEMLLLIAARQTRCSIGLSVTVEVLRVGLVLDLWRPWRRHLALEHHLPVDSTKPFVVFDFIGTARRAAHSERAVGAQERSDQVACLRLNVRRELVVAVHDLLVDADRVVIVEGRIASEHLINEDAQRPPVDALAVALRLDDLGRQVLGGAAERPRAIGYLLGKSCRG